MDYPTDELHTLVDFIRWGASRFNEAELFFGHGTDNAIDEAMVLILHALHLPHGLPDSIWHSRLTYLEKHEVLELLEKRLQTRMPAPYLTNEAWFAQLKFYVDQQVIIPRSPIAELIEQAYQPWIEPENVNRMLDLCTGSGCIAIASAMVLPNAEIDAVDISQEALTVAERNIRNYDLQHRVYTVYSDLFSNLASISYDLIVCNPPYASDRELNNMPKEYCYEPKSALAAGHDGLFFAKQVLKRAAHYLTPDGILIMEVGMSQEALVEAYPTIPFTWLEFKRGGEGILLLTAKQLREYANLL